MVLARHWSTDTASSFCTLTDYAFVTELHFPILSEPPGAFVVSLEPALLDQSKWSRR